MMITLALVGDPSVTREVSEKSFSMWAKVKDLDPENYRAGAGKAIWRRITADYDGEMKRTANSKPGPVPMPPEIKIQRVAQPVDEQEAPAPVEAEKPIEAPAPVSKSKTKAKA